MPWTTVEGNSQDIDENIADFGAGVTSIDSFSVTSIGTNRVVAVIQYTA